MKRLIPFVVFTCLLVSCGKTGAYKQAITDFLEVSNGVRTDLDVKISDIKKTKDITVADSLAVIDKLVNLSRKLNISEAKRNVERIEKYGPAGPGIWFDTDQETLESARAKLEEAKTKDYPIQHKYDGRDTTEVLAVMISCKVARTSPIFNKRQESTETFVLTPNGKKVYGRMKNGHDMF